MKNRFETTEYDTLARLQLSERDNSRFDSHESGGRETQEDLGTPVPLWPFFAAFVFGLAWGCAITLAVLFFSHK